MLCKIFSYLTEDTSRLCYLPSRLSFVRFEFFTAVTMKNAVFWDVTSCDSCKNTVSEVKKNVDLPPIIIRLECDCKWRYTEHTQWLLFRKRNLPTDCDCSAKLVPLEVVAWSVRRIPTPVNFGFLDRSRYYFFQGAPQLSSRSWVEPRSRPTSS
jgi:hypothetical protein